MSIISSKEVEFSDDILVNVIDHSKYSEELRKHIDEDPEFEMKLNSNIPLLIDESFSLDTSVKTWWI